MEQYLLQVIPGLVKVVKHSDEKSQGRTMRPEEQEKQEMEDTTQVEKRAGGRRAEERTEGEGKDKEGGAARKQSSGDP